MADNAPARRGVEAADGIEGPGVGTQVLTQHVQRTVGDRAANVQPRIGVWRGDGQLYHIPSMIY